MHLLSCEHPLRVFNKHIQEYIWVPCGKCAICKNRRAAHYTELLERERLNHRFTFFVTLTYSDESIPFISEGFLKDVSDNDAYRFTSRVFVSSRLRDCICIPFSQLFPDDKKYEWCNFFESSRIVQEKQKDGSLLTTSVPYNVYLDSPDLEFFKKWLAHGGLPYASKSDAQLFLKRLNKYAHDKVTHQFKNFRYFLVSELGSTTFRPHFHAIFFVDNQEFADRFKDCVSACWKFGINDVQYVENSACAYVAQYINKSADLPYVYQHKSLRPFFLCSRNPFIGTFTQCPENDEKIVLSGSPETYIRKKASDSKFVAVPLLQSYQNRLFPKCPSYGSVSDYVRTELYTASWRFSGKTFKEFLNQVFDYYCSDHIKSEFALWLRNKLTLVDNMISDEIDFTRLSKHDPLELFDDYSLNWIRRLFYFCRKVARQACQFGLSLLDYIRKIQVYYDNKEKYFLNKMYEYQEEISKVDADSCCLMFPEFLYQNSIYDIKDYILNMDFKTAICQLFDSYQIEARNKKTHFKNAYLDSLALKRKSRYLFNLIKSYLYAKKCNEAIEAFAA